MLLKMYHSITGVSDMQETSPQDSVYTITGPEGTVVIPHNIINIAKSTIPEGYTLESWILEWTEFGIEVREEHGL